MGIFDGLHIGYSGLSASQTGINTTSHNISNANTPGYSRQRVVQEPKVPLHSIPGDSGSGVNVSTISRIHDEFVYSRFRGSSSKLEHDQFTKDTLTEITSYFPDIEDNGIANDLKNFFNSWSDIAQDPSNSANKVTLAKSTEALTRDIKSTKKMLGDLQDRLDDRLATAVDEVNRIGKEIAQVNKEINKIESSNDANANDLRDRRDSLELRLSKLIGINVFKGRIRSHSDIDRSQTDQGTDYNINIAGRNIVDGASFHPIQLDRTESSPTSKFSSVVYVSNDNSSDQIDITSNIRGGKIGAIIALRGDGIDESGRATNSKIQRYIDDLDDFAKGLMDGVNSVYASSPQKKLETKIFDGANESTKLSTIDGINEGSFDLVVYDKDGNEVARKNIEIDEDTIFDDPTNTNKNSLVYKINKSTDDNGDNDGSNDVDDFFKATFGSRALRIDPLVDGYTIAMEDKGSNFAGTSQVHRFFKGDSASNIDLEDALKNNPAKIKANKAPVDGNNEVANLMVKLANQNITFGKENSQKSFNTIEGFYRQISSNIASDAAQSVRSYDATKALNDTIEQEQKSVSGVDMDEELVSLMKYQTAYQANAKVITTIDRMLDALLGIKQ
ncbi:MAG: flagellar hook-associated protein FlgK [Sulfurospirillum sp.]|nr:MAG: flagellar hook-associated protein FlgK [Sulfurospirillum sp.]